MSKREKYLHNSFCSNSFLGVLSGNSKIKYFNSPPTPLSGRQFVLIWDQRVSMTVPKSKNQPQSQLYQGTKEEPLHACGTTVMTY